MGNEERAAWLRMKPERIVLTATEWENFMAALDAPPKPNKRLMRLMSEPSIFEERRPETQKTPRTE